MRVHLRHQQHHLAIDVHPERDRYRVAFDGREHIVEVRTLGDAAILLTIDGRTHRVSIVRSGQDRLVAVAGEVYRFTPETDATATRYVGTFAPPEIVAPMPGKVLQVLVKSGDHVESGDGLLILEAMKMENRLVAEAAATVTDVRAADGDTVEGGQVLMVLTYDK
ncbi:MAG TPA: biotin/lipoyl-containing protein [Candidatus Binatia bacterium]|nr:biotin/lipoyl-containing protein [Candidatus Binatia bacterium]